MQLIYLKHQISTQHQTASELPNPVRAPIGLEPRLGMPHRLPDLASGLRLSASPGHGFNRFQLILQLLRNLLNIHIQVRTQKLADISILHIAPDLLRGRTPGAVDVDIHSAVAVGAPTDAGAHADHAREDERGGLGVLGESVELEVTGVSDAEAADDEFPVDPVNQGLVGRPGSQGGNVLAEEEGAVLGRGVGSGQHDGIPVVDGQFVGGLWRGD